MTDGQTGSMTAYYMLASHSTVKMVVIVQNTHIFNDHFSSSGKAVRVIYVCVSVLTVF